MARQNGFFRFLRSERFAAVLFAAVVGFGLWGYGVLSHRNELFPYPQLRAVLTQAKSGVEFIRSQISPDASWVFRRPTGDVKITRTLMPNAVSPEPLVIYGIDEDRHMSVRIIDNDGATLHSWTLDIFDLWPNMDQIPDHERPKSDPGGEIHGLVMTEDGDIIFNFEPAGLVRMDYCGAVQWKLPAFTHHSVDRAPSGEFVVSEKDYIEDPNRVDDAGNVEVVREYVTFVSPEGEITERISVNDLFIENGLEGLYYLGEHAPFGIRIKDNDILHLNDAEPFPAGMKPGIFGPGDVLISLRNLNTVAVFNRATRKFKYVHTGSYVMQHDPDFISGDEISLFDNHSLVKSEVKRADRPDGFGSRIIILNARENTERVFFEGNREVPFFTEIMGKHQWLPNGNVLVTETLWGRVFELTPDARLAWEYNNVADSGDAKGLVMMAVEGFRLPAGMDRAKLEELGTRCASK